MDLAVQFFSKRWPFRTSQQSKQLAILTEDAELCCEWLYSIHYTNIFSTLKPETLIKKEKAQQKIREERAAAKQARQAVSTIN